MYKRQPRVTPPLRHLGIYAYRRDFLENYVRWEPTPLEQTESLEPVSYTHLDVYKRQMEHSCSIWWGICFSGTASWPAGWTPT